MSDDILTATAGYETWLRSRTRVVPEDLEAKHAAMAATPFAFLRATFYRWAQRFPIVLPELAAGPRLVALGDLHTDNFGTWRDAEGRMVWGVNDFDEAHPMPYAVDLVRLATSAGLAHQEGRLLIGLRRVCGAILEGYSGALATGGRPLVLASSHAWFRRLAEARARDPQVFWASMQSLPIANVADYSEAIAAARHALPEPREDELMVLRQSGLGSLGRQRLVALATHRGGLVAREAKAVVASGWEWAHPEEATGRIYYAGLLSEAVRARDPKVRLAGRWLVRRLAPDCRRVEFTRLTDRAYETQMLASMGWEAANVHLASTQAIPAVQADLASRPPTWLLDAARSMLGDVLTDYGAWRSSPASSESSATASVPIDGPRARSTALDGRPE